MDPVQAAGELTPKGCFCPTGAREQLIQGLTTLDECTGVVGGTPSSADVVTPPGGSFVARYDGFAPPQGKAAGFSIAVLEE
ncbi:hypothetical protein OG432_34595 [Streptomyces sp. NBC_00442]|uniref:hypothetical protein n=1 Tax=Streptomyces sp. NBC_00442 TaxID=2903651 RepID=UPI002E237293